MALPLRPPPFPIAQFTVEKYHRMIAAGAFTEDDRVELIEGWVVKQIAKGPAHAYVTRQLDHLVSAIVPDGWHVRNQEPITLSTSEPEPDLAIVRGSTADYRARHPIADEVAMVIEVADTSLETDRLKGKTYARAAIPQYWIVNLPDRCIEVHAQPTGDGYARREVVEHDQLDLAIGGRVIGHIAVASILP